MAWALHSPTACKTDSWHQQIGVHRRALLSFKHVHPTNSTLSLPCGIWGVLYFRPANYDELVKRDVIITTFVTREPPPSNSAILFLYWEHHHGSHRTAGLANSELFRTSEPNVDLPRSVQETYRPDGAGFWTRYSQQSKGWWDACHIWGHAHWELWRRSPHG